MSIKADKSKGTTNQQQTSTQALDPQIKSSLFNTVGQAQAIANTPYQAFTGQRVADFNPTQVQGQQSAIDLANSHFGQAAFGQAADAAKAVSLFTPNHVTGTSYAPASATPTSVDRGAVRDVSTGPISSDAIQHYQNPYETEVVNNTLNDIERQRRIQETQNTAAAIKNHAFGGSGGAVAQDLSNQDFNRQSTSAASTLRSQGFGVALSAAQQDAARKATADAGNQGVDLSVASGNADRGQAASLFNTDAANTAARFGAGQDQAAQTTNQGAGIAGAGLQLQGAGLFGDLTGKARDAQVADVGLLNTVGDKQQANQQAQLDAIYQAYLAAQDDPYKKQTLLNQAAALLGNPTLTQSQGTNVGKTSSFGFGVSALPPAGG